VLEGLVVTPEAAMAAALDGEAEVAAFARENAGCPILFSPARIWSDCFWSCTSRARLAGLPGYAARRSQSGYHAG
jgi:hypothetical protein